jgi:hypothetical protein
MMEVLGGESRGMGCGDRMVRMMENGSDNVGKVMGGKSWSRAGCREDWGDVGEGWARVVVRLGGGRAAWARGDGRRVELASGLS